MENGSPLVPDIALHITEGINMYPTLADFPIPAETVMVPTTVFNVQAHGSTPLLQSEVTIALPTPVNPAQLKN